MLTPRYPAMAPMESIAPCLRPLKRYEMYDREYRVPAAIMPMVGTSRSGPMSAEIITSARVLDG